MASLPYSIATCMSHSAQSTSKRPTIQCSVPVPSSPSKLTKRKNYLRRKILKTLTKPQLIPLSPPNPEEPITPIEPNLEDPSEPTSEKPHSNPVQESETLFDENDSSLDQFQVVQASEGRNMESFNVFSGRMIVRIFASFVGLFILQTVVSVWLMGSGDSDEKDRKLGIEGQHRDLRLEMMKGEGGLNGNAFSGMWASQNMGDHESEVEAKIAEIRKMAREAREVEKKESLKSLEADVTDTSDVDDDPKGPRSQSGIVKEVDKRLTKLRKRSSAPVLNVISLNKAGDTGNEGKIKDENHKEEDSILMFDMKRKFRSHLNTVRDKSKGFQGIEGGQSVREKPMNMDDEPPVQITGNIISNRLTNENRKKDDLGSSSLERRNIDSQTNEKKPGSSGPLQASKKGFGSNGAAKKLKKSHRPKIKSGSKSVKEELDKRFNEGAEPKLGVVQDSSYEKPMDDGATVVIQDSQTKMSYQDALTSKAHDMFSKVQPNSVKLGSKLPLSRDNDIWWFTLPYVFVILMQIDHDSEGQQGFYTVRIFADAKNQSYTPYIVAFEDRSEAKNFNYLLESAFEDLPDATIDVIPLSTKELKEVVESFKKKVIVVKKGELQLYAGKPLDEVESALRALVK